MRVISTRRGARLSGVLLLLLFLAVLVLATGWFLARTEGARTLIAERLSDRLGVPVTIGESRIGWPYVLVLRAVATKGETAVDGAGFSVGTLRLGRRLRYWDLELRHVIVRVRRDEAGLWTPLAVARLADLREASASDITRLTGPVRRRLRLRVTDGALVWLDADGREEASLRDVRFQMEPVKLPERRAMTYYGLRVYAAAGGALGNARDLNWAWLTSVDKAYIELDRTARFETTFGNDPAMGPAAEAVYAE